MAPLVKFDLLKVGHCRHPECLALRGGRRGKVGFPSLVGLLEHPQHGVMLYDTGYARRYDEATSRFPECLYRWTTPMSLPPEEELLGQLEARGLGAADVGHIVISHFHADHVSGLKDFPRARFIATGAEYARRRRGGRWSRLRHAFLRDLLPEDFEGRLHFAEERPRVTLEERWRPFAEGWDLLGDGSLLGIDLPGHAASQLGVAFHAEECGPVLMAGDACWKVEALEKNARPSGLAYRIFDDAGAYDRTFDRLRQMHEGPCAPLIIPSHCSTTWERRGGSRRIRRD